MEKSVHTRRYQLLGFVGERGYRMEKKLLAMTYGKKVIYDEKKTNQTVAVIHTAFEDKPSTVISAYQRRYVTH